MTPRDHLIFAGVSALLAAVVVFGFVRGPIYTDAYYYINAANRLVTGDGLTDPVIWTYIGWPSALPTPSHTYWMPMPSLLAAGGMAVFNAPLSYRAAQVPYWLLLAVLGYSAFWLAGRLGGGRRVAWLAGLMVVFGGYFARFWGAAETFTPFGVFGVGALVLLGRGLTDRRVIWFALAGALSALAHLTRADGLLLVLAGGAALFWPWDRTLTLRVRLVGAAALVLAYVLVMFPWFVRNLSVIGTLLPVGGTQGIWYTEYNDIFSYPADASPARFFEAGGWELLWSSRWTGFVNGLGTLVAVEGFVVLAPFMLGALWMRRADPFLRPFWIYALGLHLAMMVVFPFPGYRGGLFHSAAALLPFWAALGVSGLEGAVGWAARRRGWNPRTARPVFSFTALAFVVALSVTLGVRGGAASVAVYEAVAEVLPGDARLMVNDPSAWYYHTGLLGVSLPNEPPEVILEIATRYGLTHVLLEGVIAGEAYGATAPLRQLPANPPPFLQPIPLADETLRLYRIDIPE